MLKKIFKTIIFISLAMCIMLGDSDLHALEITPSTNRTINLKARCCNENKHKFLSSGMDVYIPHEILQEGSNNAEKAKKLINSIVSKSISVASIAGMIVMPKGAGFFVGPFLNFLSEKTMKTKVEEWRDLSAQNDRCGVVVLYDKVKTGKKKKVGNVEIDEVTYNYRGILPQTEAAQYC